MKRLLLLLLAISLTGCQYMSTETGIDSAPNYRCDALGLEKYCDRISSTAGTCYPTEGTTIGKKYCSTDWQDIFKTTPESNQVILSCLVNGTDWTCKEI